MSSNRFSTLGSVLTGRLGGRQYQFGIEMGSSTVRMVCNGAIRAEQPSVVLQHTQPGTNPTLGSQSLQGLRAKPVVVKGVIADLSAAQTLLYTLISELPEAPSFLMRYTGWCVIPSASTQVEKDLFMDSLPKNPWITWKLLPKTQLYQSTVTKLFADTGMQSIIDIGADTTEFSVVSHLEDTTQLSETLYWGTRDLEQMLQMLIRDLYQVQLSPDAFTKVFLQLSEELFSAKTAKNQVKASFAVRAQSLATGRPVTVTLKAHDLQPAFLEWFEYLTLGLQVILQRNRTLGVSSALEQGIVVVGGGATIADIVPALSDFFTVPTTTVPEPRLWLVKGLQLLTKKLSTT